MQNSAQVASSQLVNPFAVTSIQGILVEIINVLLIFAVPVVMFFIIYAGFNYVMAQGNPAKVATASRSLMYALIGATIMFGAWTIAAIIKSTIESF